MTADKHSDTECSESALWIQENVMEQHKQNRLRSKGTTSCVLNDLQQLSIKIVQLDTKNIARIYLGREKKVFVRYLEKNSIFSTNFMNIKKHSYLLVT